MLIGMTWVAQTLWDLFKPSPKAKNLGSPEDPSADRNGRTGRLRSEAVLKKNAPRADKRAKRARSERMQDRYDAIVLEMKKKYNVRVRKWRSSSSGCAWEVHYERGEFTRLIESPYPRGPMSCAIFLHEIGHHAIGFGMHKPRCLEEYLAWKWALNTMREKRLNVTPAVEKRMAESLHYAVCKARRRGLKRIPAELVQYYTIQQETGRQ